MLKRINILITCSSGKFTFDVVNALKSLNDFKIKIIGVDSNPKTNLAYLDEHNGHEHDEFDYHYHITYTFPYFAGPTLYGEVPDETMTMCDGVSGMGPGGNGPGQ